MVTAVSHNQIAPNTQNTSTQDNRPWEIGKEIALTALPFLTLYKPLSFPVALGMGTLRTGISVFQLAEAIKEGDPKTILSESFKTTVAVISLAGTIFAHPVGLLISTGYDLIVELNALRQHLVDGNHKEALQSCLKILSHCLYLAVFLYGGPQLTIAFFALQILTGLLESHHEFSQGHYIAAIGHVLMSMMRGGQLVGQVKTLQMTREIQHILNNPQVLNDPDYVGKLAEKWQFPSDHLPVGAKVGNTHIVSWNILNGHYMSWVTEKDSQGLNGSLITQLHEIPSQKHPGLTMRDELVMSYLFQIINNPSHNSHLILNLQECSPEFVQAFSSVLPSNIGAILTDKTLKSLDQNITIFNKETFSYLENESSIALAFPNSGPTRPLMDLVFIENATQEKFRIINAHLPGDPLNPGTFDFARYLLTHLKNDCTTVGIGDMNFTELEMQEAFKKEGDALNVSSPFNNLVHYNTNIGAYSLNGKSIDHIWVNTKLPCESMFPNEVLPDLQSTVDLLHPTPNSSWSILIAQKLEDLRKWYREQELALQNLGSNKV